MEAGKASPPSEGPNVISRRFVAQIGESPAHVKDSTEQATRHTKTADFSLWETKPTSKRRVIRGIASSAAKDTHGTSLLPTGCVVKVPVPLLFEHGGRSRLKSDGLDELRVGTVHIAIVTNEHVVIEASLDESRAADAAWALVRSGDARAQSVGTTGERLHGSVDGVRYIDDWSLTEVSICRCGANPDARLVIAADYDW